MKAVTRRRVTAFLSTHKTLNRERPETARTLSPASFVQSLLEELRELPGGEAREAARREQREVCGL